jgi:hypothetical protein
MLSVLLSKAADTDFAGPQLFDTAAQSNVCVVSSVHSYARKHMMPRSTSENSHILLAAKGFGLQALLRSWCADQLLLNI